jgi:hypothetical protein
MGSQDREPIPSGAHLFMHTTHTTKPTEILHTGKFWHIPETKYTVLKAFYELTKARLLATASGETLVQCNFGRVIPFCFVGPFGCHKLLLN